MDELMFARSATTCINNFHQAQGIAGEQTLLAHYPSVKRLVGYSTRKVAHMYAALPCHGLPAQTNAVLRLISRLREALGPVLRYTRL
jgi:hypothetical protein